MYTRKTTNALPDDLLPEFLEHRTRMLELIRDAIRRDATNAKQSKMLNELFKRLVNLEITMHEDTKVKSKGGKSNGK